MLHLKRFVWNAQTKNICRATNELDLPLDGEIDLEKLSPFSCKRLLFVCSMRICLLNYLLCSNIYLFIYLYVFVCFHFYFGLMFLFLNFLSVSPCVYLYTHL